MLVIRNEQMKRLSYAQQEEFKTRAFEYLRQFHRDSRFVRDQEVLMGFVEDGIEKARAYDIVREVDAIRFLEIMMGLGKEFEFSEDWRWVVDYLREPKPAEERLDLVCERIRFGGLTPE
jgi:hypothetical protein